MKPKIEKVKKIKNNKPQPNQNDKIKDDLSCNQIQDYDLFPKQKSDKLFKIENMNHNQVKTPDDKSCMNDKQNVLL